ncbi:MULTISPECIES: signal peptidase I [unclassified Cellvibrio]|jgi:signal peptidase I|uniref:signal peptidase I n=1 Tax=unclassified Cellvibrio TaxID=2624793 RepID=UPI0012480B67|nr:MULTISPECIES: signal peptidase I [unclassified Cellvibrio]QEY13606.1 signal peptidase I [Cellvibrio sp. KY-YJ-3]UUA72984.1 signal peptidase I [Cellvibrio sp. QJXJ]
MKRFWMENRSLFIFLALMFCFRSAVADWNHVPSGSMKPTIIEGDRIGLNKMAYDLRVPFTHISLYKITDPQRGDIAIFDSKVANKRLVKRVIGIPGDTVAMQNNRLYINGEAITYTPAANGDWLEHLQGKNHIVRIDPNTKTYANFAPVKVPADHYLMLGDNRDNSADSRVIGFVPRSEFVGRSRSVIMSFDYEDNFLPRADRFFHSLE